MNCEICIKNKSRGQCKFGLMSKLGPAESPFEIVSIDTIGGLGGSRSTKRYLHLLVDHFTRYAYISTSKTQNSNDFIKLVSKITDSNKIGMILSDQYPGINSKEFKSFLDDKKIPIVFTAVNSPFSNGLNERLNQTIVNKIRCKMNEQMNKRAWATIAHECIQKYNETEHCVTGFSPKYLLDGTNVSILPDELKQKISKNDWINDRKQALDNSMKSHNYNKSLYDKNRIDHEFKVNDRVYVENGNKLNRKKLEELRIGPYEIIGKISDSIFKINTGHRKPESNFFHVSKLIPATPDML
jgi:transposase InsO family protein